MSKISAMEMTLLKMAVRERGIEEFNNSDMHKIMGIEQQALGVNYRIAEWVKRNTLRWSVHIHMMDEEQLLKKASGSEVSGTNRKGRPLFNIRE